MYSGEIASLEEFDELFAETSTPSLKSVIVQSVDLSQRSEQLRQADPFQAIFLGCKIAPETEHSIRRRGGLVFPRIPDLPFNPYRPKLYTAQELYDGLFQLGEYDECTDAQIYAWVKSMPFPEPLWATLAMALHDHSIEESLVDVFSNWPVKKTIGIMGGHGVQRNTQGYREAALLASKLTTNGFTVATGGGPGAMEAANLGGYLAGRPDDILAAIKYLSATPNFTPDSTAWAKAALSVREKFASSAESVGIPTWHYGHEPPNAFATYCAKFFSNALREDALLSKCHGGIVYLPGRAGTVQELFQTACANYYALGEQVIAPMVLVGKQFWTQTLPAWPLLTRLTKTHPMSEHIYLVDDIWQAAEVLLTRESD